jgi:hypothetical protein
VMTAAGWLARAQWVLATAGHCVTRT